MRVMVFAIATDASDLSTPPTPEAFAAMDRFTEELEAAGVLVAAAGLKPAAQSKSVIVHGDDVTVIDGPFAETKETVAGFSIWQVKNIDEAVAWAKRCPNPMAGPVRMEVRPFLEPEDLADYLTPEELATPRDGERGKLGVA